MPPKAIPSRPCTSWKAEWVALLPANGCSQIVNRSVTWLDSLLAVYEPTRKSPTPISSQDVRWVAM